CCCATNTWRPRIAVLRAQSGGTPPLAQQRRGPLSSAFLVLPPSTMPAQNRNWHPNIEPAESRITSFLSDASHHQTDSPGPPIFLSTLSRKISAHTIPPN